jgi:hypothetical protein
MLGGLVKGGVCGTRTVSDKKFVIEAIDEFRTLKRDKFLEEYGFARARIYFVLYHGEYYDC